MTTVTIMQGPTQDQRRLGVLHHRHQAQPQVQEASMKLSDTGKWRLENIKRGTVFQVMLQISLGLILNILGLYLLTYSTTMAVMKLEPTRTTTIIKYQFMLHINQKKFKILILTQQFLLSNIFYVNVGFFTICNDSATIAQYKLINCLLVFAGFAYPQLRQSLI